jgi:hypothetical protein
VNKVVVFVVVGVVVVLKRMREYKLVVLGSGGVGLVQHFITIILLYNSLNFYLSIKVNQH